MEDFFKKLIILKNHEIKSNIMKLTMFKSKIHRATVTDANLDYEGSVTISEDLMEAASIHEFEQIHIWNITNGSRLVTYVIRGARNSGTICINGAGAHLVNKGDLVILATFAEVSLEQVKEFKPIVVQVDQKNRIKEEVCVA